MSIVIYDTSIIYDIVRAFGNIEFPSGSCILDDVKKKGKKK